MVRLWWADCKIQRYWLIRCYDSHDNLSGKNEISCQSSSNLGSYMKSSKRPIEMTLVKKAMINPWQYPPRFDFQYGEWLRESFEKGITDLGRMMKCPILLLLRRKFIKKPNLMGWKTWTAVGACALPWFYESHAAWFKSTRYRSEARHTKCLLTYARIWSTLATNAIRSKPAAADWAMNHLPKKYQPVMKRAKSICIGIENEHWDDIETLIHPCADFMADKINAQIPLVNFNDPNLHIRLA